MTHLFANDGAGAGEPRRLMWQLGTNASDFLLMDASICPTSCHPWGMEPGSKLVEPAGGRVDVSALSSVPTCTCGCFTCVGVCVGRALTPRASDQPVRRLPRRRCANQPVLTCRGRARSDWRALPPWSKGCTATCTLFWKLGPLYSPVITAAGY